MKNTYKYFFVFLFLAVIFAIINSKIKNYPFIGDYGQKTQSSILSPLETQLPKGVKKIDYQDLVKVIKQKNEFILDVRPSIFFKEGHIPTSINTPEEQIPSIFEKYPQINFNSPIIIYCDGDDCTSSLNVSKKMKYLGFTKLKVYFGGWAEWKKQKNVN